MSDSVKDEVEVESPGLSVKTDGSTDPPPGFDTKKYTVISSPEQYQRYKDDFNSEYSEYRRLHAQIKLICRHITKHRSTKAKKTIHRQLLRECLKMKKTYSDYSQKRKRFEYLHNKLGHIKRSINMYNQNRLIQVLPLSSHPGNVHKAPPDRPEQYPSTSESNLTVSEDIREESKEHEEDQPCPDDPERSKQQHQLLCGEAENTNDKQHFLPERLTESGKTSYRGMKRSHDSEEEQLSLDTDLSKDPLVKIVKLSTVTGPSATEKYTVISSPEQYQRYKDDFNSEYSEYRHLHAQIELICRHITKHRSTKAEKTIHRQLLQECLKMKKTYPDYTQKRKRFEYLHNKLGHIKRSINMYNQNRLIQVLPLSSHPGNVHKAPPDRPEQYPSTSESNLTVSEDIREESKEHEEDQPCPDDPERSKQQHQLLCGEAQNTNDKQHFLPERLTESGKTSYRFRCPGPGVFQCESTGLVFVVVQEAELLYRTVQWDESLLRSTGKMAAGLLFDIKCSEDAAVCQLHLPHCEVMDAPLPEGLLSVVHITDDGMNFLEPLEITDTHVVVTVSHFSSFGLVKNFIKRLLNKMRPVSGQVLLFLGQPNPKTKRQKLNVFLLPWNIHLDEVSTQQRYSENIQVPSKCKLFEDQSYTLHCPQAIKIQPKSADFNMEFGPNYFPTFEVRLETATEEVTLMVKDQKQLVVWEYDVDLNDSRKKTAKMNVPAEDLVPAEDDVPAEQKLSSIRSQFVRRVSEPVLNQLLDKLLDLDIINDEEMQLVKTQQVRQDKARKLIDTVPKKGTVASSVLIAALRKADPNLSSQLKLS